MVFDIEQHGSKWTGCVMPACGVGILLQPLDASLVDCDQVGKGGIQHGAALLTSPAITALHQQAPVFEVEEFFRLGKRLEMTGDRAPAVAAHRGRAVVIAADAKRHPLGGATGEFRVQQYVELRTVAGSKRSVQSACEISRGVAFHPKLPSNPLLSTVQAGG
ncbi:hypothetical protein [Bradyrhizobium sp.]|uniref:hypothetical protein n=1 Tax=Bradyrhizobium sp. TaxID=376 RepID=UPI002B6E8C47|nr:hypothetical protein [Bradyrhizobium sp.]HMM88069.1 hypothetical protein [Bradyrhizobium sp.]